MWSAPLQTGGSREVDGKKSLKEQAVESILIRWHYSGLQSSLAPDFAPGMLVGHAALKGFPGVSVGLREDVLGTVIDHRPAARPSRDFLLSLPSDKLVDLWRTALTNERRDLISLEVS